MGYDEKSKTKEIIGYRLAKNEYQWEYEKFIYSLIKGGLNINELKLIVHDGDNAISKAVDNYIRGVIKQQNFIFPQTSKCRYCC